MTSIHMRHEDVEAAARTVEERQRCHGPERAMEMSAARLRAEAAYLARWTGPSVAGQVLASEAHRVVAEAAADIAVAPQRRSGRTSLPAAAKAAGWAIGLAGGFVLGLGVSGWALG